MKYFKVNNVLAAVAAVFIVFFSIIGGGATVARAAATTSTASSYSNVLDDLQKDENFNAYDYPRVPNDYSIYVIQVAESENGDLYLYTYQPCQETTSLTATHINMSLTDSVNDTELYDLTFLNSLGVFVKYRVQNVTVMGNKNLRYYNISSISREWIDGIDDKPNSDNTINEKAFPVGKLFYVMTQQDGTIAYNLDSIFVVEIINPVSGYLTVENSDTGVNSSLGLWNSYRKWQYTDLHYIAFSTDWDIDRLISATVHYSYCSGQIKDYDWLWADVKDKTEYGSPSETTTDLNCSDSYDVEYKNLWTVFTLGKKTYTWDKIYSVSDFNKAVETKSDYDSDTLQSIKDKVRGREWVLMFAATERKATKESSLGFIYRDTYFTKVDKVSVLRLEFESDGVVYNLGAVSDTVSTPYPIETVNSEKTGLPLWAVILIIIAAVILGVPLLVLLFILLAPLLKKLVILLFKGVWWLLTLPFRGLAALFRRSKTAKPKRSAKPRTTKTKKRSKPKSSKSKAGKKK